MTAAHCTTGASGIDAILGAHNIKENEASQVIIRDDIVITHPEYDPNELYNDIGLIKLERAAPLGGGKIKVFTMSTVLRFVK